MEKDRAYRIRGKLYVLSHGFGYDATKASLVPCIVVERPDPRGSGRLALASAANMADGLHKLGEWLSMPVEQVGGFAI